MIYEKAKISSHTQLVKFGDFTIHDFVLITVPMITIDEGAQINAYAKIVGKSPVHVGKHVVVSYNVLILTSTDTLAPLMDDASPEDQRKVKSGTVYLSDYSYVGANAILMPGVFLEEGATIGANSYIPINTKVPAWKFGWGQPFKIIKDRPH